jgi:glycosyltransferase involved in cell wall biosynthesis
MHYKVFGRRFSEIFEEAEIVARAFPGVDQTMLPVEGPSVRFTRVGEYRGAVQFLRRLPTLFWRLLGIARSETPVLFYLPGTIPFMCALFRVHFTRHPIFSLVVADPEDQLGPKAMNHPLRPFARWVFIRLLRHVLARSSIAMYVTEEYLQKKYPAKQAIATFGTSDVSLEPDAFAAEPKCSSHYGEKPLVIIYVAMMSQRYKGHDVLLDSLSLVLQRGHNVQLRLVGDGALRSTLESRVDSLDIRENVTFVGAVGAGAPLWQELDAADLFVMPSRAEGLPRALVEAMARGLPAISSDVGGVSELLTTENLLRVDDVSQLAEKIEFLLSHPEVLASMSAENLQNAERFAHQEVNRKIRQFYQAIYERSEAVK